jgi:hypothetical protein
MTEAEREELTLLHNEITLLKGFIAYHWGEPWRKWQDAYEMATRSRPVVAGEPIGEINESAQR